MFLGGFLRHSTVFLSHHNSAVQKNTWAKAHLRLHLFLPSVKDFESRGTSSTQLSWTEVSQQVSSQAHADSWHWPHCWKSHAVLGRVVDWSLLASQALHQLHPHSENAVSGKLFEITDFPSAGLLVVLLIWGAEGCCEGSHYLLKCEKFIFTCNYFY